MARTWTCIDCPTTGTQEGRGILRTRCVPCKKVYKRAYAMQLYYADHDKQIVKAREYRERGRDDRLARERQKRRDKSPQGFIYLLEAVGTGTFKIGYTAKREGVEKRIIHCQTGNAYPIKLRGVIEGSRMDESDMHLNLVGYRLHGEWFTNFPATRKLAQEMFGYKIKTTEKARPLAA